MEERKDERYQELKRRANPVLQKLFSSEYMIYRDLPKKVEQLLAVQETSDEQLQQINALLEIAKRRNVKLQELEFFQKDFAKMLAPLDSFKDLQKEKGALESEASKARLTRQELFSAHVDEIEKLFQERTKLQEMLLAKVAEIAERLNKECEQLQMRAEFVKKTIFLRLFEIFTGVCPYKDLTETLSLLKQTLTDELLQLVDRFYSGEITCQEFSSGCEQLAYDHDVVKLRNEISYRSSRLKDLREVVYELYQEAINLRRLSEVTPQEKRYRDLLFLCRAMKDTIRDIENPFVAFAKATNKDEINYVFRAFWMKIEEFEPQIHSLKEGVNQEVLKHTFLLAVDDLEEVLKLTLGTRPPLVVHFERNVPGMTIEECIKDLEARYPFIRPFPFFMQISQSSMRQKCLQEANKLHEHIEKARHFAKLMQYIKTFEEERVDVILEAFEKEFYLEDEGRDEALSVWEKYLASMQRAVDFVIEEVLLEIGLLDMQALGDVDKEKLTKILQLATNHAHYVAKRLSLKFKEPGGLLENLRLFCHDLFDMKVLLASQKNSFVAKTLHVLNQYKDLIAYVQHFLEQERVHKSGLWGIPWIEECHKLRHIWEGTRWDDLRPLHKKLFDEIVKIPEIAQAQAKGQDPLELQKRKEQFEEELSTCDSLSKKPELPFIYLPGYIRFFAG